MIERLNLRSEGERGWVLVTAMAVMAIMLVIGLGTLKLVDAQSKEGGRERTRESSLNTAEGLLYAQSAVLQKLWPSSPATAYLPTCDQSNFGANSGQCPNASELIGSGQVFNNVDELVNGLTWKLQVRDDVGASQANPNPIYDRTTVDATTNGCVSSSGAAAVCTYDANGDKKLWVRAEAFVNGKTRRLVALLQLENFKIPFAKNAVVGGSLTVSNAGNKTIVDTTGSQVVVRCSPSPNTTTTGAVAKNATSIPVSTTTGFTTGQSIAIDTGGTYEVVKTVASGTLISGSSVNIQSPGFTVAHVSGVQVSLAPPNSCEGWDPNKAKAQVSPAPSYSSQSTYPPALTPGQLAALEASATCVYSGTGATYAPAGTCGSTTAACPPDTNAGWTGKIVIKGPAACAMNPSGNSDINSASTPGYIVIENGTFNIQANSNYYGVVYMGNLQGAGNDPSNPVITVGGNGTVFGGIAVDGNGAVQLGQNLAVKFDANAFTAFSAAGAAGLVQNTWRELGPTQ
jgi:Tfp pilus assembly protein PilX